jgi:hypothetical protein
MNRHCPRLSRMIGLALAIGLIGCNDLAQRHLSGLRRDDSAEAPKPAPALQISNAPAGTGNPVDANVQKAAFVPANPINPLDPNSRLAQHPLRVLYQRAAEHYAGMDSYIFRLRRSETVNGKKFPEEIVRVEVRRVPFSVHLK